MPTPFLKYLFCSISIDPMFEPISKTAASLIYLLISYCLIRLFVFLRPLNAILSKL